MTERQRLDKWLWFARVVKTRTLAARLVTDGHVRLNSQKVTTPAKPIGAGDILTIALETKVRVLRVVAPGLRRGGYPEAKLLFEELTEDDAAVTKIPLEP
ncbi:RNA-binding S4 domain-containing protein [Beijerinckia indica]|uniref:RNA-binding S4 domain protein n=1 Tax=Beijerinckia indica subsp. indica (strain ATCC 9039 / DSM 1715 / NCIMB 8712) TaxID=395963 RepID=B2IC99_BEII9|nr:RNA-binding S4 domain-containing protein [Beijerinckia indica]ACB96696.1 RNA-binding S4 domain protein [Beijerinckia indica subsp. indica ATCC 9039]